MSIPRTLALVNHNSAALHPVVARQRLERAATLIHGLGARSLFELLDEIGRVTGYAEAVATLASRYAAIDPVALRLVGGDMFPPQPLREVSP